MGSRGRGRGRTATARAGTVLPPRAAPILALLTALLTALVSLLGAPAASAHSGEEPLLVEPQSTWPGGTVKVRGDLPVTNDVHLLLVDAAGRMTTIGRVDDPPSGHFDVSVTVPPTAKLGAWSIVAVAGGDPVGRASLTVGAAPPPVGDRPDQAEPIGAAGALPPPAVQPPGGLSPAAVQPHSQPYAATPAVAQLSGREGAAAPVGAGIVLGVAVTALAVLVTTRRRRHT